MFNRTLATLILGLLPAGVIAAQDPDKAYELKLSWKPVAGHRSEVTETQTQSQKVTVRVGGQVANQNAESETRSFVAVEEIVRVDGDKILEGLWNFKKAVRAEEGKEVPYGFQDRKVRVTRQKEGPPLFACEDGTKPEPEDEEALKDVIGNDYENEKGPSAAEVFAPNKPVKAGESWSPSVKEIAGKFMGEEMAVAIDVEKSKGSFTLKSVEVRDGVEYGKIEGTLDLVFKQFGPLKLDKPIPARISVRMDVCIDGKLPAGEMRMDMTMKGASPITTPDGAQLELEMDMTLESRMSKKPVP